MEAHRSVLKKCFSLPVFIVLLLTFSVQTAKAGDGTFTSTGGVNGTFDFCVVIQFNATPLQIEYMHRAFQRGSDVLADATEGHHRFGKVNFVNNCGNGCAAAASAEWFVINTPGISGASASEGGFGVPGTWGQFAVSEFDRIGLDQPGSNFNLNIAGFTVAHEFSHAAYGVSDEYSGVDAVNRQQHIRLGADCAPGVGPGTPPHDDPNLSYCLMDYFFGRGGMADNNIPKHITLKEYCVASNHDPDRNNNQSLNPKHQNMSCWETIASVPRKWRLPLPPGGLPNLSSPPSVPISFGTTCGEQKVVLLIDRSGSMADESRLDFAKLGASLFIRDLRSDGYFGLVSFADDTRVDFPLAQLTDDNKRNTAINAINALTASGNTDIGDGMISALGQLTGQNNCSVCSKTIVLLTDGDHNTGTPPQNVVAQLQQANVKLDAIVIGNDVSVTGEETLKNITTQTGGKFYRLPAASTIPGFGSSGLQSLFLSLANDINGDSLLDGQASSIATGQVKEIPVFVEQGAAFATFAVTQMDLADNITLSLRSPSGGITSEANSQIVESLGNHESAGPDFLNLSNSQLIRVASPQAGTWTMVITAGSIRTGSIETLAMADHLGVRLNVEVSSDDTVFAPDPVEIHATPFFNASRTVGANVSGTAKRPDGSSVAITLFDDGSFDHADSVASDGIYSTRFSDYSTDGTYTFDLTATNVNGRLYEGELDDSPSNIAVPPFIRKGGTTTVVSGIASGEAPWSDDSLPMTATPHGDNDGGASGFGEGDNWYWVSANPGAFSGTLAHQSTRRTGFHQHYSEGARPLRLGVGDKLFAYVFLDINNMPEEIMLQWNDNNNWEHRAYWGQNRIGFGSDGTNSRRYIGPLPVAGQWVRLEVPASLLGLEESAVTGMAFSLYGGRATWDRVGRLAANAPPMPSSSPGDFVFVEDAVPPGAISETVGDQWLWLEPHYSGQLGHRSYFTVNPSAGQFRAHSFRGAATKMNVNPGDVLFTYVFLDGNHMPDELVLQWHDGAGWEHRAFWGQNLYDVGRTGTESLRYLGGLPAANRWVRLEVPASYVGLEGKSVGGMSFGFYSKADHAGINWDYSGKSSLAPQGPVPLSATLPIYQVPNGDRGVTYSTNVAGSQSLKFYAHPNQAAATVPMYRFRRPDSGNAERFYAQNLAFYTTHGWVLDSNATDGGIAFYVYPDGSTPGSTPLYLYHDSRFHYFLTTDQNEANSQLFDAIWGYTFATNPLVPAPPSFLRYGCGPTWRDNSATETGFKIERSDSYPDNQVWSQIATVGANVTFYKTGCHPEFYGTPPYYRVRAYNAYGDSAYSNVACSYGCVYLDSDPGNLLPDVNITNPIPGEVVTRDFNISANASDENGNGTIAKVEFYADGSKLGESLDAPYFFFWSNAPSGVHSLTAVVTDANGESATSAPVSITVSSPPTTSIVAPANGAVFTAPAGIQIQANASDADGSISKVEFFQGEIKLGEVTAPPYHFSWTNVSAGAYSLTARATDNLGAITTSAPSNVTVNAPPTVGLISPTNNSTFTWGSTIQIAASASDSDGTISKVEIYQGATLLGQAAPGISLFYFNWNSVLSGTYSVTAIATDDRGSTTTSTAITLTVSSPPAPSGYSYKRTVTIDHTKVPNTDQSNFPVLISGTYPYLATTANGGNVQNANGYDVIFTSDVGCGTQLNHEVESYNAVSGAVSYWVKLPTVSHTTDTVFYMCYGKPSISSDQSNKAAVWDANYKAVWHVADGTNLNLTDSTANHNLTNNGATATTGKVDGGANFNGSSQYLSSAQHTDFNWANLRAVEVWMKLGNTSQTLPRLFSQSDGSAAAWSVCWFDPASGAEGGWAGKFLVVSIGTQAMPSIQRRTPDNGTINSTDAWHQVAVIGDGTTVAAIYVDGDPVTVSNYPGNITNTTVTGLDIGRRNNNGRYYAGGLDEIRFSNSQRSADWLKTEYNNQSSPSSFYAISTASSGAIFSDDFNGTALDNTKWSVVDPNSSAVVSDNGQQLQVTLAPNTAAYNGVFSNSTYDLTGRMIQVEVAQPISQAGWSENFIVAKLDANNSFLISSGSGSLVLRSLVGGVNDQTVMTFDATAHRYWRIRHNASANMINFETSPDGNIWTTLKTASVGFSLTSLRFSLYAGAWGTGNGAPGAAKYDNFQLLNSN